MNTKPYEPTGHGALISPEDENQFLIGSVTAEASAYPDVIIQKEVEDLIITMQGKIGSCVANTGEEVIRLMIYLLTGKNIDPLSWRFLYALAKSCEGKVIDGVDYRKWSYAPGEGTYPSLVATLMRKYGISEAQFCPNNINLDHETFVYNRKIESIPKEAFENAKNHMYVKGDFTVPVSVEGIKQALTFAIKNHGAVMILRRVGDTYWKDKNGVSTWDKNKLWPIRKPEVITSGHEELLYGCRKNADGTHTIKWLNSWSEAWCSTGGNTKDGGYGEQILEEWLPLINEIRVVVSQLPTEVVEGFKYTFTKTMKFGDKNNEVVALQTALKSIGLFPKAQAITGKFGPITLEAVKNFQLKYSNEILKPAGLMSPTGFVGSFTLNQLNVLFAKK